MRIVDDQIVYANPNPGFASEVYSGTGLTVREDTGTEVLVCAFRAGSARVSPDGRIMLRQSRDGGRTWSRLPSPMDATNSADIAPPGGLTQLAGPHIGASTGTTVLAAAVMELARPGSPEYNAQAAGIVDAECAFARHTVDGWSAVQVIDGSRSDAEWSIPCGSPVNLGGSRWITPAERHGKATDGEWLRRYHAFSFASLDDGRTWFDQGPMMNDPAQNVVYYDQHVAVLPDGRLIGIAWVHDVIADRTLTARAGWSSDNGVTWSEPRDTGILGGPVVPVVLPDGRLFAVYPRRDDPTGIRACLSDDGGVTWDLENEFVIWDEKSRTVLGQPVTSSPGGDQDPLWDTMWAWTFGLPTCVLHRDGTVGVAFYATDRDGRVAVHYVRIET